ncbi:MAG TPA: gliding motility-associated C-terminal domain-containing protein [Bacteroidia bacterium]|jgi:gliding motility-associated-like protein/uncharacterized repeat protein (TIGR01451 family)
MKKFILILILSIAGFSLKAQSFVSIPDSNFVTWLTINIPSAMSGNQMDTNNVAVTTLISMNVSFDTIYNLEGIQYFKSLRTLDCSNNKLDTLLNLPDSLQTFVCRGNRLSYLLEIPDSVTFFDCSMNQLDSLPLLPSNLLHFDCQNNSLTGLSALSDSMTYFNCQGNQLTSLPSLPTLLTTLYCAENQLTTLPLLPSLLTAIYCENNSLTSLPALPPSLDTLNCGSNLLTSLPALSAPLTDLECYFNQLTALPSLPSTLITLVCGGNLISALPPLPASLITLKCYGNQLTSLPALPASLDYLDCGYNIISALPALPSTLTYLNCERNQLTSLPALSSSIQILICSNNLLPSIPALPVTLYHLSCSFNPLVNLPALPASLAALFCSNATLDSLPVLPPSLYQLDCSNNSIVSLPSSLGNLNELWCNNNLLVNLPPLPSSLYYLICHSNNINCFEEFSNSLYWLEIYGNLFSCLPNYLPIMDGLTLLYPLCVSGDLVNNPNACTAAKGIVGFTYTDINSDCAKDSTDGNLTNIPIKLYDNTGTFMGQTYTALNGVYHFPEPIGTYQVSIDTTGMPISPQCANPGVDSTLTLTLAAPLQTNVNFGFDCKSGIDIGVRSVSHLGLVFPGESHQLHVDAGDMTQWYNMACAAGTSGQVQMTISGPVTFSGITAGALMPTIAGNIFTYSIADFGAIINTQAFGLILSVNTTAASGNQICVEINVTPSSGDNDSSNNSYNFCYQVVNSHDPNMKETYPEKLPLNYSDWITYTIHFQNTGNAPAININLRDTLDSQLDLSTFEAIGHSHSNQVLLNGNNLAVQFPNIYLTDSTSSSDSSKGYFQYRIKPLSGLTCGAQIKNTASIYFDFNEAIVTNTTINSYPESPDAPLLSDTTVCSSGTVTIDVSANGNTINWYDAGNSYLFSGSSYTINSVSSPTLLYAQAIAPSGCSSPIEDIIISVSPAVLSPLLSVSDTICYTDSLSLFASSVSGWNYHWSGPAGFISTDEDPVIAAPVQNNSGMYSLYISNGQCISNTANVYIKIDSLPVLFVTNNPSICLGDSIDLYATGNVNSTIWGSGETSQTIKVSPMVTTLYTVTAGNTCGSVAQNVLVKVNLPPVANAGGSIISILGESTPLHAEGGNYYIWYPAIGLDCSNCQNPLLTITADQSYTITVTDTNGCSDTANLSVKVVEQTNTVYIPNSFTPDNDDLNDKFIILGSSIQNIEIEIYDRLGNSVFQSSDKNISWDGSYKNTVLNPQVYIYIAKITFNNGEERKHTGTITLIK